ncbi:hypothetical protein, partial [Trinickia fusca]|uniref:hypothetical protein n=1 Tax=Trinickia fusca TaxID=2419777 RepID=UPI001C7DB3A7
YRLASLRQQQRNEIMQTSFSFVNCFFRFASFYFTQRSKPVFDQTCRALYFNSRAALLSLRPSLRGGE